MTHQIVFDNKSINFEVIKSGRRKTSEITVDPQGVIVRVPSEKRMTDIEKIVRKKAGWIISKQQEYNQSVSEVSRPTFEEGSRLPYLGKMVPLEILKANEPAKVRLLKGKFLVLAANEDRETIRLLYENWLKEKADNFLPSIVAKYSKALDVSPTRIVVKNMRKRWGSATKNNVLNLNVNLLKAPEDAIEYIVLHELCHLIERNHSRRFWDLISRFMPDYRNKAEWLRMNALGLIE